MENMASRVMEWSRPIIAVFGLTIFALAFAVSWWAKDTGLMNILVGAVVAMVSTITGYYFGSSAGSQKKDDVIAATAAAATAGVGEALPTGATGPTGPHSFPGKLS